MERILLLQIFTLLLVPLVVTCGEINQCVGCIGTATPSSRRRVDGVQVDATIQRERAVKF